MWNLSMRDPLPKNNYNRMGIVSHYSGGGYTQGFKAGNGNSSSNPMQVRRNKSDYCCILNKGVPCKFGPKCKFIKRCKYCDSPSHGVNACQKLLKKTGGNNNSNAGSGNANSSSGSGDKK